MQFFETSLSLVTFIIMLALVTSGKLNQNKVRIFGIGCAIFALHLLFEVIRWQMSLTYLLFLILALLLFKRSRAHFVLRLMGSVVGLLLLFSSLVLTSQFPLIDLPPPTGSHRVGTTFYSVTDESRQETHSDIADAKRELFVEVWYPASDSQPESELPQPRTLWQELYTGDMDRVSFFMDYLRGIDTHSYPDIPIDSENGPYPVILYNHGLQMFTSQNTLLMEHLASHGYVVISVAHPYESLRVNLPKAGTVIPKFITSMEEFNKAMEWIERTSRPVVAAIDSIKHIESEERRAEIMLNAIETSEVNQVVSVWVEDTRFVLDDLMSSRGNQLLFRESIDLERIGAMGMSVGGATAAEFCKSDTRCIAGINVDGLQYGVRQHLPLEKPFMMIYSDDGFGVNDFLKLQSNNEYYEYYVMNSRHADFTDLNLIWPIMRIAGQMGETPGERMNHILNEVVRSFMDHYLKNKPFNGLKTVDFPELKMEVKVERH